MSGQYLVNFTQPSAPGKTSFIINSLETQGPGSLNVVPVVTVNGGVGGNFSVSGDFTPRFIPGFAFNIVNSLVVPTNDGAYVVGSSVFQGTSAINLISAVQKKFVLNGFDYTAIFTNGRIFKITNSTPSVGTSNDGYWIVASSTFTAGNTEIVVQIVVPSGYRSATDINDTEGVPTGSIITNLTVILPTIAIPTTSTIPDGDITYTLVGNTSLTLPGRGTVNYGLNIIEDLVHILENFYTNDTTQPSIPTKGQLWFDGSINTLKVYDNTNAFVSITGGGGGNPPLNTISAAVGANTISNTIESQVWNWQLTTDPKVAFTFGESAASTGGAGNQVILNVATLSTSTAAPLRIAANGIENFKISSTGEWVVAGSVGTAGQVLESAGPGLPPAWATAGSTAIPLNEVAYGTGPSITSSPNMTFVGSELVLGVGNTLQLTIAGQVATGSQDLQLIGGSPVASGRNYINLSNFGTGIDMFGWTGTGGSSNGGHINLTGGDGDTGTNGNGGPINLVAGNGGGTGLAGNIQLVAGQTAVGNGGAASLIAGNGGTTSGAGGAATVEAGSAPTDGVGGVVSLIAGDAAGADQAGGSIFIITGNPTGVGASGNIIQETRNGGFIETLSGSFTATGDAQSGEYTLRTQTTDATSTELFLDGTGGTRRMVLINTSSWNFEVRLVARETTGANVGWTSSYVVQGAIHREGGAASTALVAGTLSTTLADDSGGVWTVTVSADTTNGALIIQVTGQAATTIRWVAFVRTVEVVG
jgi:hypothetical protein